MMQVIIGEINYYFRWVFNEVNFIATCPLAPVDAIKSELVQSTNTLLEVSFVIIKRL
jgi:hypothetical protein